MVLKKYLRRYFRGLLIVIALTSASAIAGVADVDVVGQSRATPNTSLGATEVGTTFPATPQGVTLTTQRVTL